MMKKVSFIHAADLHLDSPFKGLAHVPQAVFHDIRESTFSALDHLVQVAIEKKVDFVLLVGDLFDHEEQSLKAQIRLRSACEQLQKQQINVYMSHGNHDYINGNIHPVSYPDNVFIFPDEKIRHFTYPEDEHPLAAIYGFSYENQAVTMNKAKDYNLSNRNIPFHIATLHGSIHNNKDHDPYAPFQVNDLTQDDFDYWALGHIHKRQILKQSPPILYPGNTQGRHHGESGDKGCYHVVLTESGCDYSFIPLHSIRFESMTVDVSHSENIYGLESMLRDQLKNVRQRTTPILIRLHLVSADAELYMWEQNKYIDEIIDVLNEAHMHEKQWIYIYDVKTSLHEKISVHQTIKNDHFISELSTQFEKSSIHPLLTDLYHHRQGRKFLEQLTTEEEQTIKEKAEQLLISELLKGKGE